MRAFHENPNRVHTELTLLRILDLSLLLMLCIFVQGVLFRFARLRSIGYLLSCCAGMTYLMILMLTKYNICEKFLI